MTDYSSHPDVKVRMENLTPKDLKALVGNQGKLAEWGMEIILKEPLFTDPILQAIVRDPEFEVRLIGEQLKNQEMYLDVRSKGHHLRIKVACHKTK